MKFLKNNFAAIAALCLCASAAKADPPSNTVNPRNAILFNAYINSNAVPTVSNIMTFTNLYLSAPYQHNAAVTTLITATNQVVPAALNYTNYFDLAKIVVTNNGSTNVYTTNWTSDQPIQIIGLGTGFTNSIQARTMPSTNFDGYELIRLTKVGMNTTNNYLYEVVLSQTP
jgi:hypothetical protein